MSSYCTIFAIESSCDETSVAILRDNEIMAHEIATHQEHSVYGGVIPELASRKHDILLPHLTKSALEKSKLKLLDMDAIAYTKGPGLMGALLVGSSFAKSLAWANCKPLIGVNHMEAHALVHFLANPTLPLPFLCLTVSGGHTQLVWIENASKIQVIGETRDDAVGEAIDKAAKLLGLPYPGGPQLDALAKEGNPYAFRFPIAQVDGLDFSFSGIKTALLYTVQRDSEAILNQKADLCASYLNALCDMLLHKFSLAISQYRPASIGLAGGVSANSQLRAKTISLSKSKNIPLYLLPSTWCTDNAAMIAKAAQFKYKDRDFESFDAPTFTRIQVK